MSIYDKASLVQIPSGVKSGTLYNVVPNTADGDFDFTRSSTATRINKDGLIETVAIGVPRLDYPLLDGVVQDCPALLLEPVRANKFTYSEDFTQWTATGSTVGSNEIVSPDGSTNADKISYTAAGSRVTQTLTVSSTSPLCFSVFLKAGSNDGSYLRIYNINNAGDVGTNEITDITSGVNYGNGWYRHNLNINSSSGVGYSSGHSLIFYVYTDSGKGVVSNSNVYVWGAQLEDNAGYVSSYIPTSGSQVTRSADVCNGAEADFNDSEGVLFAEIAKDKGSQYSLISLQKTGATNTYAYIGFLNNTTQIKTEVKVAGTSAFNKTRTFSDTSQYFKVALKYKSGDYALWINGFETDTGTSTTIFSDGDLKELELGNHNNSTFRYYGKSKQLMTFNEALSDTELENLTSWDSFREMATEQLYTIE